MDRGAWLATVHGVAESVTQVSAHARVEKVIIANVYKEAEQKIVNHSVMSDSLRPHGL